jgi:hypothetical protein
MDLVQTLNSTPENAPQPSVPVPPTGPPTPPDSSGPNGVKEGLIGFALNAVLTVFLVNTIGVIASGIYLGLAKNKGKFTYRIFFILSILLNMIWSAKTVYPDPLETVFVNYLFVPPFMAVLPLGIAAVIRKITKR